MNIFVPNGIKNQNQNFSSVVDDLEQQFKKDTLSLSQVCTLFSWYLLS